MFQCSVILPDTYVTGKRMHPESFCFTEKKKNKKRKGIFLLHRQHDRQDYLAMSVSGIQGTLCLYNGKYFLKDLSSRNLPRFFVIKTVHSLVPLCAIMVHKSVTSSHNNIFTTIKCEEHLTSLCCEPSILLGIRTLEMGKWFLYPFPPYCRTRTILQPYCPIIPLIHPCIQAKMLKICLA